MSFLYIFSVTAVEKQARYYYNIYKCAKLIGRACKTEEKTMTDIQHFHFDECDSTNTRAKEYLKNNSCDAALFTADTQSAGRGRCGKSFYSQKDCGVYMTFVKRTDLELCDTVFVTTFAACAVTRALERLTGTTLKIKWVNDIYLDNKKICGILTENVADIKTGRSKYVIIGVGVNLTAAFPKELCDIAGNLGAFDKTEVTQSIVRELSTIGDDPHDRSYMEYYRAHSLVIGRNITYFENGKAFNAFAVDVDNDGGLVVQNSDKTVKTLRSGEISVRFC